MVSTAPNHTTPTVATPFISCSSLLHAAIEELMDGMLIITAEGEIVASNRQARQICQALNLQAASLPNVLNCAPQQVWHLCQQLITTEQFLPGQPIVPEFEIVTAALMLRVRLRWLDAALYLNLPGCNHPYLLVILEQRNAAPASMHRLSQREYQVWQLRTQGYSYQSIANQLYISTHTVKKHLKNIRSKQRSIATELQSA
jgi:DNA-binding CsgD family transcriptional regulator